MSKEDQSRERDRDLVLNPQQYAFILDETKGNISVYVGPAKTSLANTDRPVRYSRTKSFEDCRLEEAIRAFPTAEEGHYIVLENPSSSGNSSEKEKEDAHPRSGSGSNVVPRLNIGRKINIPGPIHFPLWPGQVATVIQGHHLRSNQYLIVRVYNEELARANWSKGVMKPQAPPINLKKEGQEDPVQAAGAEEKHQAIQQATLVSDVTMGQLMLIRGTEVSFYMPPTGIEVVPDETNQFVRSAVTLERLEYCILLDEGGNKRYVRGPAVVFPEPTETFIKSGEARKFRAIDLNPHSGLYIKVISPYKDGGKEHKEGDELFITGKDQMIYFPRPEHAIIKYGDQSVHYAVAIPAGEARYVLDRDTGTISTVKGPAMFLPDPRRQVIVRRVLDEKTVTLWYPGNVKALEYNRTLAAQGFSGFSGERASRSASPKLAMYAASTQAKGLVDAEEVVANMAAPYSNAWEAERPSSDLALDEVQRKGRFTQPRTLSLDTKYEGAPAINVWTGYAVMVVGKNGARQIVQGPKTVLLEYDETLEVMELSMGTPKSDITMRTVYLRVSSNKVSDLVQAMTKDMVNVSIKLSYRVNFEGDTAKWFNVENYVKFLTDHLRSIIRNAIKQVGIENFNNDAIQIVRTAILGPGDTETKRIGKSFQENGMRTYDVEILDVAIGDSSIATMLVATQHQVVKQTIAVAQREAELEATKRSEKIQQQIDASKAETRLLSFELQTKLDEGDCALKAAMQGSQAVLTKARLDTEAQEQKLLEQIAQAQLARKQATEDQRLGIVSRENELKAVAINAEAEAVIKRAGAVTPQMIAALQAFGDKVFVEKLLTALGPHALLRGNSVADVFAQLVNGSPQLGDKLTNLLSMASVPEREKKEEATV